MSRIGIHARRDRDLLRYDNLTERERLIADAATRLAWDKAADWLSDKQAKAEAYPGGNAEHARGRANAYQTAAQEIYGWAIGYQPDDSGPAAFDLEWFSPASARRVCDGCTYEAEIEGGASMVVVAEVYDDDRVGLFADGQEDDGDMTAVIRRLRWLGF